MSRLGRPCRRTHFFAIVRLFSMVLLVLNRPVWGQEVPSWLDETFRVQPLHWELAGEEPALTRLDLHRFDVSGPGEATERFRRVVTVFEPAGRDRGVMSVGYDGMRRIRSLKGRLRDGEGRVVRELRKSDVQDYSAISDFSLYEDSRVRVVELYHDRYPYTVEFEVEMRLTGLISWPTWYPQTKGDGLEYGALEVRLPQGMPFRHVTRRLDVEPVATEERGRRILRWAVKMLPPFKEEEFGPPLAEQLGSVHTAPALFEVERRQGDMSSWLSFGRWYADLSRGADVLPPDALQDAERLVADAADDMEKVRRIYEYVQRRTRYVSIQLGIGGWRPFDAAYVHQRGYGDCKALTNYTVALLRAIGIEAYPALIRHGVSAASLLDDFPSNQFNHVIAFVPTKTDTVWLETTSQTIPFGHLGAGNEDRFALVVREEGGELLRTPRSSPPDNRQSRRGRVVLETDGSAHAEIVTVYSGNQQDRLRGALAQASGKEREEWLHRELDVPQFEIVGADFGDVGARSTSITLPVTLRLPRYAASAGPRVFLTPMLMDRWSAVPAPEPDRTQEINYFSYPFLDTDTLEYVLPPGYEVEALPAPMRFEASFGRFESATMLGADGVLKFVRRLEVRETRLPAGSYEEFRDFLSRIARSDRAQVVLVREGS